MWTQRAWSDHKKEITEAVARFIGGVAKWLF
jgi:hypothetical protein